MITKAISQHQRSKDATDLQHEAMQYDRWIIVLPWAAGFVGWEVGNAAPSGPFPTAAVEKKREFVDFFCIKLSDETCRLEGDQFQWKIFEFCLAQLLPMRKVSAQISGQMCIKWHHISTKQLPTQLAYTNLMSWSHDLVKSSSSNLAYIPFTKIAPCNW